MYRLRIDAKTHDGDYDVEVEGRLVTVAMVLRAWIATQPTVARAAENLGWQFADKWGRRLSPFDLAKPGELIIASL